MTTELLTIPRQDSIEGIPHFLPASKSISNRVLIMNAFAGKHAVLHNLSDANDTQLMLKLLPSNESIINVEDAGTTMRFLTGYFAVTNASKTLTGTARMKERPIALLVDALKSLGAEIQYVEREGYPPIVLKGFKRQLTRNVQIRGDVSSQYISALMMIAPGLPEGLQIELLGKIGSRPYIEMTASLMRRFGIAVDFSSNIIFIKPQQYQPISYTVESDWSAASYWYSFVAMARSAKITLPRMTLDSLQGDRKIDDIMRSLGVQSSINGDMLTLEKIDTAKEIHQDFTDCPDLAQTVAVVCAVKGVRGVFTGLESLRIKETDRIAALQNELGKIGAQLREENSSTWIVEPSTSLPSRVQVATYHDHRMAMAFAPLATQMEVVIEDHSVTRKSYPKFWEDMRHVGFSLSKG